MLGKEEMSKGSSKLRSMGTVAVMASALPLLVQPMDAMAQDTAFGGLEEITVTAQRRAQSLQDVPVSVTAFSSEAIERLRIRDTSDYFAQTPNVSFASAGSRARQEISIRGVQNNVRDLTIRAPSFGFYIDEFSVVVGTQNPQIHDIERIEVLRGPQGTYFGRNAIGGAINIVTNKPGPDLEFKGSLEYGRFDTWAARATVNVPIIADKFFVRASGSYAESDGYIQNLNEIGGSNDYTYSNFRIATRTLLSDRLTLDLSATYTDEEEGLQAGVPTGVLSPFTRGLAGLPFLAPLFPTVGGVVQAIDEGTGFYPNNRRRVNMNQPQEFLTDYWILNGRLEYAADDFLITSITGYIDRSFRADNGDIDRSSYDAINELTTEDRSSFSQELRVSSTGSGAIDWTVGALYAKDKGSVFQDTWFGTDTPLNGVSIATIDGDGWIESYAAYADVTWHATERLEFIVGGRYSRDKVYEERTNTSFGAPRPSGSLTETFEDFSPRFAATYQITDDLTAYGTVSKGYKTGGIQLLQLAPNGIYDSETVWNFEGGLKGAFLDRRLLVNLTYFHMKWKNLQVPVRVNTVDGQGNVLILLTTGNADKAKSEGVELEVTARPVDGLTVGGGLGYLNARYTSYADALIDNAVVDLTGERLVGAPEWTANAYAEQVFPIADGTEAFIRGEWSYRSESIPFLDASVHEGFPWRAPAFSVWNFRAGIDRGNIKLTAFLENAFNKNYYTTSYEKAFFGGVYVSPSVRRWGLQLSYEFN